MLKYENSIFKVIPCASGKKNSYKECTCSKQYNYNDILQL